MKISIYELIGLIKDGKAPKQIKIDNDVWYLYKKSDGKVLYIDNETSYWDSCTLSFEYYIENNKLNDAVEILPEENDEWENIEEINSNADNTLFVMECYTGIPEKAQDWNFNILENKINQLIKNQRKIIEKLDKNEIMFDYYVEKLEAKEKLESKDD